MKPFLHAKSSAKKYGGVPGDYMDIHEFMDSSKAVIPDVRHRCLLHSSFGCFIVEKVFGSVKVNSDNKEYSPRDVAEDHCIEDLGFIPTVDKWMAHMPIEQWMGGPASKNEQGKRFISLTDEICEVENEYYDGLRPDLSRPDASSLVDAPIEVLRKYYPDNTDYKNK